jgi:hypothetical protein
MRGVLRRYSNGSRSGLGCRSGSLTPLQYAEKINAARSGMAKAAGATGRDETLPEEDR